MRIIFLMKIRVDGGYINYNPSTDNGEYCYYIQDHIGNNRVILSETRGVIQYADYYPYGIPFSEILWKKIISSMPVKNLKRCMGFIGMIMASVGTIRFYAVLRRWTRFASNFMIKIHIHTVLRIL